MEDIAKSDSSGGLRAFNYPPNHPAMALWVHPHTGLLARLAAEMDRRSAHPARTLVLLPYAQLLPLANRLWPQYGGDGFAPRFETTLNWASSLGGPGQQALDITFDAGLDALTAQALLAQAGLGSEQDVLAALVVQAAYQLAPLAAATHPTSRAQWAHTARSAAVLGMEASALQWEAAVARIAVEWAAVSGYASDPLWDVHVQDELDCLVMVQGLASDPLLRGLAGLAGRWGDRLVVLPLAMPFEDDRAMQGLVHLHAAIDAEDEAQRSAACALRHIEAGRFPVALVSSDRALTRRVRAMLEDAGVTMRDENGWKLSTSRAGASVMVLMRAGAWNASADAVLDWLKCAPAFSLTTPLLEAALRRDQVRDWRDAVDATLVIANPALVALCESVDAIRATLAGRKLLTNWLDALRCALQWSGQWDELLADGAGAKLLLALRLSPSTDGQWQTLSSQALWAKRRMDASEFVQWLNQALEGASFQPDYPDEEQVVILPMSQMLGRPFAALVLAGCDEVRLNPNAEPPGGWTAAQRTALGLPTRDTLEAVFRCAWRYALQTPVCDVLWRTSDETGETLLASSLVQLLQLTKGEHSAISVGDDPRVERMLIAKAVLPPQPVGSALAVTHLSASAYEDLRACPYRFFALRQLGLRSDDELESEIDKRDFGLWLHAVLSHFHASLVAEPTPDVLLRMARMDAAAAHTTAAMALPEGEFLPFLAAWPAVRNGYLHWLGRHEAQGFTFISSETDHRQRLGDIQLLGRIDRMDRASDGSILVLDYKTEPPAKTRDRVKMPLEDTQIAFYAALLPDDTLRGAYVNVGEREGTAMTEQQHIVQARDALIHGILHDIHGIAQGQTLPALGDGSACDFCQARGLCRKDFWL